MPNILTQHILKSLSIAILAIMVALQPAMAQSILRDAETEAFLDEISEPLILAAELDPDNVQVVIINDPSINAFVSRGQIIYLHSGLIEVADTANEVQGVIAHELGHIVGGHVIRFADGASASSKLSIGSLILAAAAIAAGAGEAGIGILGAGQQLALGNLLSYNRVQESVADASGASYLSKAGISGKGSIAFFKKLQGYELRRGIRQTNSFNRTHPLSGERVAILQSGYIADPAWDKQFNEDWENKFLRVQAKLSGFITDPDQTLRNYPEEDKSIPARYARAYAWHKSAYPAKAIAEAEGLVEMHPNDPYFLELKGQIMLESGRPEEALADLRKATELSNYHPLIAAVFGHALIATEDPSHLDEATEVLRVSVSKDNRNPFAWYQLGVVYQQQGDYARASLASAERFLMIGQPQLAVLPAKRAQAGLDEYSADWLRAQDVEYVALAQLEQRDGKKKKNNVTSEFTFGISQGNGS